jgi:predicted aldo/keto reductase-like oxidoreductase
MRYQQSWNDMPMTEVEAANQTNLEATIRRALELGINHIETARGYGSSERQLGQILPTLPREEMIVQTKIPPAESAEEFRASFDDSMERLGLEHVDLLAIHGINDEATLDRVLTHGSLEAAQQIVKEGRARHLGFSSHAMSTTIVRAIETDAFSYVNLHWFFVDEQNTPSLEAAARADMGVFIISPNDKGGCLYNPPEKLTTLCAPLSAMGFGDLYCLARPEIQTISIGASCPEDFDAHMAILDSVPTAAETIVPIVERLHAAMEEALGREWLEGWRTGLPAELPGDIHPYHILRLYNVYRGLDMEAYAKMRYNLLGSGGHWFPGMKADALETEAARKALAASPFADLILERLQEAHTLFGAEDQKRLSES